MKKILEIILNILARGHLRKYKPMIIGITGNVGKTSTKEAIATVVRRVRSVRVNAGNLNNELGLPLTILGDYSSEYYSAGAGFGFWFKVLAKGLASLSFKVDYPEVLVLEYGADHPGDIKKLVKKFRPHIGVVTAVGEIPVHVEYFEDNKHVAREKAEMIKCLDSSDFAVLNYDDLLVRDMASKTKAEVLTYGFSDGAKLLISNYDNRYEENGQPAGITFKMHEGISFVPFRIDGSLGQSLALASGAAAAVGQILGLNLVQIGEALKDFKGQPGRLKILKGIKNTMLIDDSYNASPAATALALEVLKSIQAKRKIAILGDMLELGKYSIEAHEKVGRLAGDFLDILICVGPRAKFIAEKAGEKMNKNDIYVFDNSSEAKHKAQELIAEGDLVLIKGSQGMRMEKVTEEIMAEPDKKLALLVRQSETWLKK